MEQDFKAVSERVVNGPPHEEMMVGEGLEPDRYRHYLDTFDLTRQQEDELMRVLWDIASRFVEWGFGTDVIHHVFSEMFEKAGNPDGFSLNWKSGDEQQENQRARDDGAGKE